MLDDDLLVPIRLFESLEFCPRQAWYRFVLNDDRLNIHMERGLVRHEMFDEAEVRSELTYRHVPVVAPRLGVRGVLDEVRIEDDTLFITEVKAARLSRYVWPGIELHLAAQRLALAEQAERGDWSGEAPSCGSG